MKPYNALFVIIYGRTESRNYGQWTADEQIRPSIIIDVQALIRGVYSGVLMVDPFLVRI